MDLIEDNHLTEAKHVMLAYGEATTLWRLSELTEKARAHCGSHVTERHILTRICRKYARSLLLQL